jgi:ADP-heptose:LPS heptosyltransferase
VKQRLERTQNPINILRDRNPLQPGLLDQIREPIRKIVVLRASRIGDFICVLPALHALRQRLPQAEISMITLSMLEDLVLRSQHLDRFISFPGYPGLAEQLFEPHRTLQFFSEMQSEKYDLALQLQGSGVNANPFMLMLGARYTAGFVRPGDAPGRLDAALPLPETGTEVERVQALMTFLGAPPQESAPELTVWEEDLQAASQLLADLPRPWIGVHPAARDLTRRWPPERFARAAAQLQRQYGGNLVLLGEERDREENASAFTQLGLDTVNLCGQTSLAVLGGVIAQLSLLLTNDSGPAHIAYALRTPAVVVFGGADFQRYKPSLNAIARPLVYPVPCRPCSYRVCPIGAICLKNITVDQVIRAAKQIIRIEMSEKKV